MKVKPVVFVLLICIGLFLWQYEGAFTLAATSLLDFFDLLEATEISPEEIGKQQYYTMVDEKGREILVTGRKIHEGDEYIDQNNNLYRVTRVQGYLAHCRFIRKVGDAYDIERPSLFAWLQRFWPGVMPAQTEEKTEENNEAPPARPKRLIGIYHTHNDESYIPTDGTFSLEGRGGIHHVGKAFAETLQEKDVEVIHDETLHLPHDRGAYRRSRATVEKILAKEPDVIFDIHRDAGPAHTYAAEINGEWVTQVHLVVGRQNPNMQTVRQFALDLKKTADRMYPKLVKGIFMAHGNYNQDLVPTSLLLEFGTENNSRDAAADGASLFAEVVAFYFYGPEPEKGEKQEAAPARGITGRIRGLQLGGKVNVAAVRNAFWLLTVTAVSAFAFYVLNTPLGAIRKKLAPWAAKTLPFTEKGDLFLEGIAGYIRAAAVFVAEQAAAFIRRGDEFLQPVSAGIEHIFTFFKENLILLLDSGDKLLAFWRRQVKNVVQKLRETAGRLWQHRKLK